MTTYKFKLNPLPNLGRYEVVRVVSGDDTLFPKTYHHAYADSFDEAKKMVDQLNENELD